MGPRILVAIFSLFLLAGCAQGIRLSGTGGDDGTDLAGAPDGIPGSPKTPTVMTSSGAGVVTSPNLIVLVRTGATSFKGNTEGDAIQISDPALESGIEEAFGLTEKGRAP